MLNVPVAMTPVAMTLQCSARNSAFMSPPPTDVFREFRKELHARDIYMSAKQTVLERDEF